MCYIIKILKRHVVSKLVYTLFNKYNTIKLISCIRLASTFTILKKTVHCHSQDDLTLYELIGYCKSVRM